MTGRPDPSQAPRRRYPWFLRFIESDRGVAIFTGVTYLVAALLGWLIFDRVARETGQVDGRVVQVSMLFSAAMAALWALRLVILCRRR